MSTEGLSTILSQEHEDGQVHPVAYSSRVLSPSECNYSIMEKETLAVVWATSHFQFYLYGRNFNVYTDHTVVKAVLIPPVIMVAESTWAWQAVKKSKLTGKCNANTDALSCGPQSEALQET